MRRRKFSSIIPLLLLAAVLLAHRTGLFLAFQPERPDSLRQRRHPCQLVKVLDGDTIVVRWRGRIEHLRLLRINTPERGQPGYEGSAGFLRNLLSGKRIEFQFEEPTNPARDKYGRLLAYVFADGENVNVEMVRVGWSPFWTKYGRGKYADAFEKAQSEANSREHTVQKAPSENSENKGLSDKMSSNSLRPLRSQR